jgi:salicylate 5-hydroxylase small subunit
MTMGFEDYFALNQLYADYARAVDSGNWDLWPAFFIEDCSYRLQPRENHERGLPLVHAVDADGTIHSEANYAVFRTKLDQPSTVFNVGRYIDTVVPTPEGLKFASRLCVFDSEMIPNSIIYPI